MLHFHPIQTHDITTDVPTPPTLPLLSDAYTTTPFSDAVPLAYASPAPSNTTSSRRRERPLTFTSLVKKQAKSTHNLNIIIKILSTPPHKRSESDIDQLIDFFENFQILTPDIDSLVAADTFRGFIAATKYKHIAQSDFVFKEGDVAHEFYFILRGEAEIIEIDDKYILDYGNIFGEPAMFDPDTNYKRRAWCRAISKHGLKVAYWDRTAYNRYIAPIELLPVFKYKQYGSEPSMHSSSLHTSTHYSSAQDSTHNSSVPSLPLPIHHSVHNAVPNPPIRRSVHRPVPPPPPPPPPPPTTTTIPAPAPAPPIAQMGTSFYSQPSTVYDLFDAEPPETPFKPSVYDLFEAEPPETPFKPSKETAPQRIPLQPVPSNQSVNKMDSFTVTQPSSKGLEEIGCDIASDPSIQSNTSMDVSESPIPQSQSNKINSITYPSNKATHPSDEKQIEQVQYVQENIVKIATDDVYTYNVWNACCDPEDDSFAYFNILYPILCEIFVEQTQCQHIPCPSRKDLEFIAVKFGGKKMKLSNIHYPETRNYQMIISSTTFIKFFRWFQSTFCIVCELSFLCELGCNLYISTEECESLLSKEPEGTFMFRLSNIDNIVTLSYRRIPKNKKRCKHIDIIRRNKNEYQLLKHKEGKVSTVSEIVRSLIKIKYLYSPQNLYTKNSIF